jgi:hypothetical protein
MLQRGACNSLASSKTWNHACILTREKGVMTETSDFKLHDSLVRSIPIAAEIPTPMATARTRRLCCEWSKANRCGAWCSRISDAAVLTTANAGSASVTATPSRKATASKPAEDNVLGRFSPSFVPGRSIIVTKNWGQGRSRVCSADFVLENKRFTLRIQIKRALVVYESRFQQPGFLPMGMRPCSNPKLKKVRPVMARHIPKHIVLKP